MLELQRQPLASAIAGPGIAIRVRDVGGQYLVSGPDMPPNTIAGTDPCSLWLAPGRRLVVGGAPADGAFVSDLSDGLVVIELDGGRKEDILAMASPLDPALLAPGRCAQTLFAGIKILVYRHAGAIRLHVERPLAEWLLDWLRQAVTAFETGKDNA